MKDDDIMSTEEVLDELIKTMQRIDDTNWGPWKLDRLTRKVYIEQPTRYSLSIDDLRSGNLALTLMLFAQKTWADNECLGGLVRVARSIADASADPVLQT